MINLISSEKDLFESAYSRCLSGSYEAGGLYSRIIQDAETTSWLGCFFPVISWITGFHSRVSRAVENAFQLFNNKDSEIIKSFPEGLSPYQTYQKWSKRNIELQTSGSTAYSSFIISIRSIFSRNASRLNDSSRSPNIPNSTPITTAVDSTPSPQADEIDRHLPSFTNEPPSSAKPARQLITQADLDQIKERADYNAYLGEASTLGTIDRSSITPFRVSSTNSPTQSNHSGSSTIDVTQQPSPSISLSSPISKTSSPISRKPANLHVLSELKKIKNLNNIPISEMRQYGGEEEKEEAEVVVVGYDKMMQNWEEDLLKPDNAEEVLGFMDEIQSEFPIVWNKIIIPLGLKEVFVDLVYQCEGNMGKIYQRLLSAYTDSLIYLEPESASSKKNTLATPVSIPSADLNIARGMLAGLQRPEVQRVIATATTVDASKSTQVPSSSVDTAIVS